ncbi:MAG: AAA family ATPase, partial [Desulfobacterales bacterium]
AEKIGCRVIDREILEYIANEGRLGREAVALFDESYPGKLGEFLSMLVDKKAFIESDYSRRLIKTIILIANFEHTIFVGRGTHLVLPRERVLAVRFVCSREYRMKRLAEVLNVPGGDVGKKLDELDKDQNAFFKKVYGKKDALAYEFDMMIDLDYIRQPKSAANIVAQAFKEKFGAEAEKI